MYENNAVKKIIFNQSKKALGVTKMTSENNTNHSVFNCSSCQNPCQKCKSLCITCKSPCQKCALYKSCKNSFTDTDDFDKYLESQFKKIKIPTKVKAVGVDTCDLDGHFDYFKLEKQAIRIQKSVATDCADLNIKRLISNKAYNDSIATDANNLLNTTVKFKEKEHISFKHSIKKIKSECHINCNDRASSLNSEFQNLTNNAKNLSFTSEDNKFLNVSSLCQNNVEKENFNFNHDLKLNENSREITFNTSSDESDIDLMTSCKLSKSKELAKKYKMILKQISTDQSTLFKCIICKKIFFKKHLGTMHLSDHIENDNYKCLTCTELFNSLDSLLNHANISHLKSISQSDENFSDSEKLNEMDENDRNVKISKVYKCTLCTTENSTQVQFDSYEAFSIHNKTKHNLGKSCKTKRKKLTEKKIRIRQEFICLICGKEFKSSKALKDHSPVHTGEKNYLCDICNKSYTTNANLKIHKRTHTGARNFVCSVCNKAFHKKDSLKVHFRKHSGERPFQCDLCPMRFDRNYILKNHRYTHFSEKKFICPFCGKTFTTHGGLNNHEKSHKKDPYVKKPRKPAVKPTLETENAVICDVCGKIYSTKSNLRIHKFVHLGIKPFECRVCHQSYAKKDSMLTHMRKHFDDRPFSCDTCGMKFYRNHTLKTHLLRHTGEKPHKCKMCGKSFTQSSSLAYHLKNHDKKAVRKSALSNNDSVKLKKNKMNVEELQTDKGLGTTVETDENFYHSNDGKQLIDEKKCEKNVRIFNGLPEKDLEKGNNFLFSGLEKEIFVLDKNLSIELAKSPNVAKETDLSNVEKDEVVPIATNVSKFNYYIAKSQIFSLTKDSSKEKPNKCDENYHDLAIPKTGCITKEQPLLDRRETNLKNFEIKNETVPFVAGEILNASFVNDENGEVIPFGPMAVHSLNSDHIMISPIMALKGHSGGFDDRKGLLKNSKIAILDSKIAYSLPMSRAAVNENCQNKSTCQVINLKDQKFFHKIHIELDSPSLQMQTVADDAGFHEMTEFYDGQQQNEL